MSEIDDTIENTLTDAGFDTESDSSSVMSDSPEDILRDQLPTTLPELFENLDIDYEDLRPLPDGASHLVYAFKDTSDSSKHVIRVTIRPNPDDEDDDSTSSAGDDITRQATFKTPTMTDQVAILKFLEPHAHLFGSIPKISHFDDSYGNRLGRPYMIESFIEGEEVEEFEDLSSDEQAQVVVEVAKMLQKQDSIKLPTSGTLEAKDGNADAGVEAVTFKKAYRALETTWDPDISIRDWVLHLLNHQVDEHIKWGTESGRLGPMTDERISNTERLRALVHEMDQNGIFRDPEGKQVMSNATLCHPDMHFGNFLTSKKEGRLEISGVIDWDSTEAAPLALSREPPYWLWEPEGIDEEEKLMEMWDQDYDYLPKQFWSNMSDKSRAVKQQWDALMSVYDPSYLDDAYGRGLWIRRVAKFAMWGFNNSWDFDMLEWMCDEWHEYLWNNHGLRSSVPQSDIRGAKGPIPEPSKPSKPPVSQPVPIPQQVDVPVQEDLTYEATFTVETEEETIPLLALEPAVSVGKNAAPPLAKIGRAVAQLPFFAKCGEFLKTKFRKVVEVFYNGKLACHR